LPKSPNQEKQQILRVILEKLPQTRLFSVEAPPGAGKTLLAVLAAKTFIEAHGLAAGQRVLVLTFSRMARAQLEREAEACLDPTLREQVEVTNFHAFFQRFVFAYAGFLGLGCAPDIPCPSDWTAKICESVPGLTDVKKARDRDALMSCLEFSGGCVPPHLSERHHALLPRVRDAVLTLNAKGLISQSDLTHHFARLLKRSPFVLSCLRRKYPFLVLDEYQDASDLQDAIVRELLGENGKAVAMSDVDCPRFAGHFLKRHWPVSRSRSG
jgi:superfamily I DNA/RNA helicase